MHANELDLMSGSPREPLPKDAQVTEITSERPRASAQLEATLAEFSRLEDEIATDEEALKEKKARAKYLGENVVVELVDEEHLINGCRLSDGREYIFERTVRCGIAADKKPLAFEYLEQKGADTMLRRYLTLSFGKDSKRQVALVKSMLARVLPQYEVGIKVGTAPEDLVGALRTILDAADLNISVEQTLELPGPTLTAFVKKELKAGRSLPEAFGVYAPLRAMLVEEEEQPGPVGG